jgi:hypothetical protein
MGLRTALRYGSTYGAESTSDPELLRTRSWRDMQSQGVVLVGKMEFIAVDTNGAMALVQKKCLILPPCADHVMRGLGNGTCQRFHGDSQVLEYFGSDRSCGILWENQISENGSRHGAAESHRSLIGQMHSLNCTKFHATDIGPGWREIEHAQIGVDKVRRCYAYL